ncbi:MULTISPECIES: hypothetical protein [Pseudoalteromonas]|uniref:Uncharacterized protein n=1 Tax=Pseudoalteromonas fuliginea TaxID=1872678 RepID=A0ABQ6RLK7_9GAMM|nr:MULTISPECIES: hypothetical protein [Pseudoalteromonas]ATG79114.1 hypothetical protein AOR04_17060 [Pseudoalteromonas sp. 1_2015MBL_MicDiv]KAA1163365.1 hypothetical protein EU509_03840 [Pseudoalteromonas fuliginea]KAA1168650.1 hypothetical protein EUZ79_04340 [Pseudoalteromonas fuliginea]
MHNNIKNEKHAITAHRTNDGLIEITSLELLDALVGGYISPDEVYCQVKDNDEKSKIATNHEGIN